MTLLRRILMQFAMPPVAGTDVTGDVEDLIFSELDYEVSSR